jgi:hypothetical protein
MKLSHLSSSPAGAERMKEKTRFYTWRDSFPFQRVLSILSDKCSIQCETSGFDVRKFERVLGGRLEAGKGPPSLPYLDGCAHA